MDEFDEPTAYPALGYKVKPRVLDISRGMTFVSMKDQVVRGRWVVDALVGARALSPSAKETSSNPKKFELLIIGAGVAGVAAGLRAAELNIRTLIVDRAGEALSRQENSNRLVSLSLYDWPVQHWDKGPWPHVEPVDYAFGATPSPSPSCLQGLPPPGVVWSASNLVKDWKKKFDAVANTASSCLKFEPHCGLISGRSIRYRWTSWWYRVKVMLAYTHKHPSLSGTNLVVRPQIVLFALGPPPEETRVGEYTGMPFWSSESSKQSLKTAPTDHDCLADKVIGDAKGTAFTSILISGGGDSAVQDFLRAVLLPLTFHNLEEVIGVLKKARWTSAEFERLERDILAAVWQSERVRQLGGGGLSINYALHLRIENAVEEFVKPMAGGGKGFDSSLALAIDSMLRPNLPIVTWIIDADPPYFGGGYVLNRFLGILFLKYLKYKGQPINVQSGKLASVELQPSSGDFYAEWVSSSNAQKRSGVTVNEAIIHHGPSKTRDSQPVSWTLLANLRYRGLRNVFERLVQPFKPIT